MPTIKAYTAPPSPLRPSDRGMQEWETYARRAGPLYNAAAQGVRERGRLAGDDIESRDWQLNFLSLYHSLRLDREEQALRAQQAAKYPTVQMQFGRGRGSGDPRFGAGYGMAGGTVSDRTYAGIAGANALATIASGAVGGPGTAPYGSKGGMIAEPPTYRDELQRDLASDPYSFDDLMTRLTGGPPLTSTQREAEAEQYGGPRKFEEIINDPLGTKIAQPQSSTPFDWAASSWNPANWGWPTFGASGDSAVVTEGREGIK